MSYPVVPYRASGGATARGTAREWVNDYVNEKEATEYVDGYMYEYVSTPELS